MAFDKLETIRVQCSQTMNIPYEQTPAVAGLHAQIVWKAMCVSSEE